MCSSDVRKPLLEVTDVELMIKCVAKTFRQFRFFLSDPIPKNEKADSAERFIKFLSTLSIMFKD